MAYKVLVVEDERIVRQSFERVVNSSDRYVLAGVMGEARGAAQFCLREEIDLVLMDVVLGDGIHGLEASRQIKALRPQTRIIVVTSMPEVSYLDRAREIGVESFWYKEIQELPLLELMDRTMAGESLYPDATPSLMLGKARSTDLTGRELEVLREMVRGATNAEIARRLCISEYTVKVHITHMMEKTGFSNRTLLAIHARTSGLVVGES